MTSQRALLWAGGQEGELILIADYFGVFGQRLKYIFAIRTYECMYVYIWCVCVCQCRKRLLRGDEPWAARKWANPSRTCAHACIHTRKWGDLKKKKSLCAFHSLTPRPLTPSVSSLRHMAAWHWWSSVLTLTGPSARHGRTLKGSSPCPQRHLCYYLSKGPDTCVKKKKILRYWFNSLTKTKRRKAGFRLINNETIYWLTILQLFFYQAYYS